MAHSVFTRLTHALGFLLRRFWERSVDGRGQGDTRDTRSGKNGRAEGLGSELDPKLVYDLCCTAVESEITYKEKARAPT